MEIPLKKRYNVLNINGLTTLKIDDDKGRQKDFYTWILLNNNLAYTHYLKAVKRFKTFGTMSIEDIQKAIKSCEVIKFHRDIRHRWPPGFYDTFGCVLRLKAWLKENKEEKHETLKKAKKEMESAIKFQKIVDDNPRKELAMLHDSYEIDRDLKKLN